MATNRGRKYYNNGIINKMFKDGDTIPEGFIPGMKERSEESKRETIRKNLLKYGAESPNQCQSVKDRKTKTYLERYGVSNPNKSEKVLNKTRKTNLSRYGVECGFQSKELRDKARKTCVERYGVEVPAQSKDIQDKMKQTNLKKYGVEYTFQSEEVKSKIKESIKERYGVDNPSLAQEVKDKRTDTMIERFGVENVFQSEYAKDKSKQTCLSKYGVEHASQSKDIQDKFKTTCLDRYGVDNPSKVDFLRLKISERQKDKDVQKKRIENTMRKYGVPWTCMLPQVRRYTGDSGPNKTFASILTDENIEYEREFVVGKYQYDFKVGNTLIEINPTATHNTIWSPFKKGSGSVDRFYHADKTHLAEDKGYRVIHIFDWDDVGKVLNLLKDREKVYARKCIVKEIGKDECGIFLQENHLQGSCRGQDIRLGLFYQEELVSLMTFGRPRYNSGYEWELLRYCSVKNVIGGAEKIFKYFISTHKNCSIISYCDRSKFRGDIYKKLGFKIMSQGLPSCHWYNLKNNKHYTDNLIRQRGVDQILKTSYGKGTDNTELMIKEGYVPVYDCGQDSYVYKVAGDR